MSTGWTRPPGTQLELARVEAPVDAVVERLGVALGDEGRKSSFEPSVRGTATEETISLVAHGPREVAGMPMYTPGHTRFEGALRMDGAETVVAGQFVPPTGPKAFAVIAFLLSLVIPLATIDLVASGGWDGGDVVTFVFWLVMVAAIGGGYKLALVAQRADERALSAFVMKVATKTASEYTSDG